MVYFIFNIYTSIFEIIDAEVGQFSRFFEILVSKSPKSVFKNPLMGKTISGTKSDILKTSKIFEIGRNGASHNKW
jgi:hypothetical protein